MARPRKSRTERRAAQVGVRFTGDEIELVTRAAERAGMTVAGYVRRMALAGRVTVQQNRSLDWPAFDQLRRIGLNLNQATKLAHAWGRIPSELLSAAQAVEAFIGEEIARHGPAGR